MKQEQSMHITTGSCRRVQRDTLLAIKYNGRPEPTAHRSTDGPVSQICVVPGQGAEIAGLAILLLCPLGA
jgi:hypothetical protein